VKAHAVPFASAQTQESDLEVVMTLVTKLRQVFSSPSYRPPLLPTVALEIHRLSFQPDVDADRLVAVDVGGLTVLVPRAYDNGFRPAPGAAVELVIPAAAVHVVPASPVDAALASSVDGAPASPVDGAPPSPPAHSPIVNLSR